MYIFVKFFGLGLGLNCFFFRSRILDLKICRSRFWSWSRKNYRVLISKALAMNNHNIETINSTLSGWKKVGLKLPTLSTFSETTNSRPQFCLCLTWSKCPSKRQQQPRGKFDFFICFASNTITSLSSKTWRARP